MLDEKSFQNIIFIIQNLKFIGCIGNYFGSEKFTYERLTLKHLKIRKLFLDFPLLIRPHKIS